MKITLLVLAVIALALAGCGGNDNEFEDESSAIAKEIGSDACGITGYTMTRHADGSKRQIYMCAMGTKVICVTKENGIVSDETARVRALFANTLAADRPLCLTKGS